MTQGWAVATGRHNRVTWGRRKRRIICPSSVHCSSLICLLARPDRCAPFSCAQCDVSFSASLFLALMNLFSPPPPLHPPSCVLPPIHFVPRLPHLGPRAPRSLIVARLGSVSFLFSCHPLSFFSPIVPPPQRNKKKFFLNSPCVRGPLPVGDHRVHGSARCNGRQ